MLQSPDYGESKHARRADLLVCLMILIVISVLSVAIYWH